MATEFIMPDDILVAETHEYVRTMDDDRVRVGITEYAAGQLGDIVFVELPDVGQTFDQNESFGSIESVKAQSELYLPVAGEIIAVNTQLSEEPQMVNDDPYNGGWMLEILLSNPDDLKKLMDADSYLKFIGEAN
ncbi:glycine cleavage system protein GcvH [Vampirovibrio chlorellavorus]|jgi:glycine cleavage system H protein|uniref:glycine cleavage system protein GcvH n=1 Tax=Vampirovibrio chlorellavorus TaxID=758823 RepID=UPI000AF2AF55|nr:glycine cleavage system protein GcvH [Vampirovibrio chlorellavorus]